MKELPERSISIMIVDDEPSIRRAVSYYLQRMGYDVRAYDSGPECLDAFEDQPADIVITDLRMPQTDGLDVLRRVKDIAPSTEVIIVTAYADKKAAIEALRAGAYNFFEKPIILDELGEAIRRTAHYQTILRERDHLAEQLSIVSNREAERWGIEGFVGKSKTIRHLLRDIRRLQQTDATNVLITGESGTGKELIARAIHFGSARARGPFIPVNCSAIPGELAESAFFGHAQGAFTGAAANREGYFVLADGGTLFLDEIGDMPPQVQVKLLRVLEDGVVMPVGTGWSKQVDVRILAATNADMRTRIAEGTFRQDLYYRLARFTVEIPSLREHDEDIPLLAYHFVKMFATEMGLNPPPLSPEVIDALKSHNFPGNVRELKNIIERGLIESGGAEIQPRHLHFPEPIRMSSVPTAFDLPLNIEQAEASLIKRALAQAGGNMAAAARLLGINRTKLYRKLAQLQQDIA